MRTYSRSSACVFFPRVHGAVKPSGLAFHPQLIVSTESRIDVAAQWQWRMLRMGYGHTVVVARGQHSCSLQK